MATAASSLALPLGQKAGENEKRWLTVGMALNTYVVPCLTNVVKRTMDELYKILKSSVNIHQQTEPNVYKTHVNKILDYGNINANKDPISGKKKPKINWDYKVGTSFDLARLFMQFHMAKSASFEECDASGLLGLIINVDDTACNKIFKSMRTEADFVRECRNTWAHCRIQDWTQVKYNKSFYYMHHLLEKLQSGPVIQQALKKLQQEGIRTASDEDILRKLLEHTEIALRAVSQQWESETEQLKVDLAAISQQQRGEKQWLQFQLQDHKAEIEELRFTIAELEKRILDGQTKLSVSSAANNYRERLMNFHESSVREDPCQDVSYITTEITVANLDEGEKRINYREYEREPSKHKKIVVCDTKLFQSVPELKETKTTRSVLILGVPGVGKTSFCYKLLHNILQKKLYFGRSPRFPILSMLREPQIPFLIKFRDINLIKGDISFCDLLLDHFGPSVMAHEKTAIWKYLQEREENICFILDGADEGEGVGVHFKEEYTEPFNAVDKQTKPQRLLFNLIKGHIMPGSKVLLTSRTFCLAVLRPFVDRILNLNGLDDKQIHKLMETIFGPDLHDLKKRFIEYLKNNQHIAGLCHVPRQAKFLFEYVKEIHCDQKKSWFDQNEMPESMAGLLLRVMVHMLKESDRKMKSIIDVPSILRVKGDILVRLSNLAFQGIFSDDGVQQCFTDDDIAMHRITMVDIQTGIMSSHEILGKLLRSSCFLFSFLHLTFQEMLAGLKLLSLPVEELKRLILQCHGEHQMTWLLFFGACGDKAIIQMIPSIYPGTEPLMYKCKAREVLRVLYESARDVDGVTQLFLIHALNESNQLDLADRLTPALMDWTGMWWIPDSSTADHTAVARYLSNVRHYPINIINVSGAAGASTLQTMLTGPNMTGYLGLWVMGHVPNDVMDVIAQITREHTALRYLYLCRGPDRSTVKTSCFVTTANTSIKHLTLLAENMDSSWFCTNLQQLHSLEVVILRNTNTRWQPVLRNLQSIRNLTHLSLYHCRGIDNEAADEVCQLITTRPLTWLHLEGDTFNPVTIRDLGIRRLAHCLQRGTCRLTALILQHCSTITTEGHRILCESLHHYPYMKILGLDVCNLDYVSRMLQENTCIQELYLLYSDQTDGFLHIPANTALTYLQCEGEIWDEDVKCLTTTMRHAATPPRLRLSTHGASVTVVSELITKTHLHTLDLCDMKPYTYEYWQKIADAVCCSRTMHTVGIAEHKPFLQGLVEHYPRNGPLTTVYCRDRVTDTGRFLVQRLKAKLGSYLQVYFNVRNMGVQAGYKWQSVPIHTRLRMYWYSQY